MEYPFSVVSATISNYRNSVIHYSAQYTNTWSHAEQNFTQEEGYLQPGDVDVLIRETTQSSLYGELYLWHVIADNQTFDVGQTRNHTKSYPVSVGLHIDVGPVSLPRPCGHCASALGR